MVIGIDFDGTCVSHEFPEVGKDIGAVPVLKKLVAMGHLLVLFTMRSDKKEVSTNDPGLFNSPKNYLSDAVQWFKDNNIPLYGIQTNPTQKSWTDSPKAYCQLYIDDAALGCPLCRNEYISKNPFVNWAQVETFLITHNYL